MSAENASPVSEPADPRIDPEMEEFLASINVDAWLAAVEPETFPVAIMEDPSVLTFLVYLARKGAAAADAVSRLHGMLTDAEAELDSVEREAVARERRAVVSPPPSDLTVPFEAIGPTLDSPYERLSPSEATTETYEQVGWRDETGFLYRLDRLYLPTWEPVFRRVRDENEGAQDAAG